MGVFDQASIGRHYRQVQSTKGFTQEFGINYDETYAQVMRSETWRLLIVMTLYLDWESSNGM